VDERSRKFISKIMAVGKVFLKGHLGDFKSMYLLSLFVFFFPPLALAFTLLHS